MQQTPIHSGKRKSKLSLSAILSFLITLLLCMVLIVITISNRAYVEKLEMSQLIMEKSTKITEVISQLLYKTESLASLVVQNDGQITNFEKVAAAICDDPAIANVLIAPDGIVSAVYPLKGNEAVIGLNFFSEGDGNREAMLARETGSLVFGGPFTLVQGYDALVGRLPVYTQDENGEEQFWGLVSVTLKYPDALESVQLNALEAQGYTYEIWRYSPDTGERQTIATGAREYNQKARFIEKDIHILNADWYFKVAPVRMWYQYPETWVLILASLLICLLIGFVMQNNHQLRMMKSQLEYIASRDSLTGIYTRRHFMEKAPLLLTGSEKGALLIIDVDNFKHINDQYGHPAGDELLIELSQRILATLRPNDLFARYGGEEFILLRPNLEFEKARAQAVALCESFAKKPICIEDQLIPVTISIGVAPIESIHQLKTAIAHADHAMYEAKRNGRNQAVAYTG